MSTYSRLYRATYRTMYGREAVARVGRMHRLRVERDGYGGWSAKCGCADHSGGFAYRYGADDWHADHLGMMLIKARAGEATH